MECVGHVMRDSSSKVEDVVVDLQCSVAVIHIGWCDWSDCCWPDTDPSGDCVALSPHTAPCLALCAASPDTTPAYAHTHQLSSVQLNTLLNQGSQRYHNNLTAVTSSYNYFVQPVRNLVITLTVCMSARITQKPQDRTSPICCPWPWLGSSLMALWYVMYFQLCGWRHVFIQWPYASSCVFLSRDRTL